MRLATPTTLLSAGLVAGLAGLPAHAAVLDFETGTAADNQFTQNFRVTSLSANSTASQTDPADAGEPNNDYFQLVGATSSVDPLVLMRYDTTPGETATANTFTGGPVTVTADVSFEVGGSLGIFVIDAAGQANNIGMLLNFDGTGTNERIRFFKDATNPSTSTSVGTIGGTLGDSDQGVLAASPNAAPVFETLTLEYSVVGGIPVLEASLGSFSATSNFASGDAPGTSVEIGFRVFGDNGAIRLDNVNVIPEPASLLLVATGLGMCVLRRRHA